MLVSVGRVLKSVECGVTQIDVRDWKIGEPPRERGSMGNQTDALKTEIAIKNTEASRTGSFFALSAFLCGQSAWNFWRGGRRDQAEETEMAAKERRERKSPTRNRPMTERPLFMKI